MTPELDAERLVFFGDSYSDLGIAYDLTGGVLAFPYPFDILAYQRSFTNGAVWTEYAETLLGAEGSSYAIGGAEAAGEQSLLDYIALRGLTSLLAVPESDPALDYDINLAAQVDRFLAGAGGGDLSDTAAWLFFGLNDYLNFILTTDNPTPADGQALVLSVVEAIVHEVQRLSAAGVGEIFVSNLPSVEFLPFTSLAGPLVKGLAEFGVGFHNAYLEGSLGALEAAGLQVTLIDLNALTEEIVADPTAFGFVAPLDAFKVVGVDEAFNPVFNPALDGVDEDQFAFWDVVHPTTATHGLIATYQAAAVTHEFIEGTGEADKLSGSDGDDLILASGGDDRVMAGSGDDIVLAGLGDDAVNGADGDDIVIGGSGNDTLRGGDGNDLLGGGHGNDLMIGGAGNDVLVAGLGSDLVLGGDGDDVFLFTDPALTGGDPGADHDILVGGDGEDRLYLALSGPSREAVETALSDGASWEEALTGIDLDVRGIETIVIVESRQDFVSVEADVPMHEADLWGIF